MADETASYFNLRWQSQLKKGLLEYISLLLLNRQDYYGYELIESIKNKTTMEVAEGTLYPMLNRLKKEGLVSSKWHEMDSGIPRKYYTITVNGKEQLQLMDAYLSDLYGGIMQLRK